MPHHYGDGGSAVVPTAGLPPEPAVVDPQVHDQDNTDVIDGLINDLNAVRDELSAMMGEDFKAMQCPAPVGDRRTSTEEMDRTKKRRELLKRESQISAAITEQRGGI